MNKDDSKTNSDFDVLAAAAHDFKTPLALIYGLASELDNESLDPEFRALASKRIGVASRRLINMVEATQMAQRVANEQVELQLSPVDIASVVDQAAYDLQPIAEAYGHDLRARISRRTPTVMAHKPSVVNVVYQVLDTAIRSSKPKQKITIDVRRLKEKVGISITDASIGIKPAEFYSALNPGSVRQPSPSLGESSGISLYIASQLVEAMQGDFTLQHQNGGSVFLVKLPQVSQLSLF